MACSKIRVALSRVPATLLVTRRRAIARKLASATLGILLLALVGWGRDVAEIAITTMVNRVHCVLRDTILGFAGCVRDVMASVHSCSFYLGQASGTIAHGFARLHPDRLSGLAVSAAVVVAIAYSLDRVRYGAAWSRAKRTRITRSANKSDVIA
jgi:hypothetical protein